MDINNIVFSERRKVTYEQSNYFAEFMVANPNFARRSISNLEEDERLWTQLTNELNFRGPPNKTEGQWKKVSCHLYQ